jgi:hypothetical protein
MRRMQPAHAFIRRSSSAVYVRCSVDLRATRCEQARSVRGGHTSQRARTPRAGGRLDGTTRIAPRQVHAVLGARFLHGKVELVGVAQRRFVAQHLRVRAREGG